MLTNRKRKRFNGGANRTGYCGPIPEMKYLKTINEKTAFGALRNG